MAVAKEPAWLCGGTRVGCSWPTHPASYLAQRPCSPPAPAPLALLEERRGGGGGGSHAAFGPLAGELRGASPPAARGSRGSHPPARRRSSPARLASESAAASCSFSSKTSARKPGSASASLPAANSTPRSSSWEGAEGAVQGGPRRPPSRRPVQSRHLTR